MTPAAFRAAAICSPTIRWSLGLTHTVPRSPKVGSRDKSELRISETPIPNNPILLLSSFQRHDAAIRRVAQARRSTLRQAGFHHSKAKEVAMSGSPDSSRKQAQDFSGATAMDQVKPGFTAFVCARVVPSGGSAAALPRLSERRKAPQSRRRAQSRSVPARRRSDFQDYVRDGSHRSDRFSHRPPALPARCPLLRAGAADSKQQEPGINEGRNRIWAAVPASGLGPTAFEAKQRPSSGVRRRHKRTLLRPTG